MSDDVVKCSRQWHVSFFTELSLKIFEMWLCTKTIRVDIRPVLNLKPVNNTSEVFYNLLQRVGTPFCGKCDVIFSYIYANTTKLVLHLSYLIRSDTSDCFLLMKYCFKITILAEICTKMHCFENLQKSPSAGSFRPPRSTFLWRLGTFPLDLQPPTAGSFALISPITSGGWGSAPRPYPLLLIENTWPRHWAKVECALKIISEK